MKPKKLRKINRVMAQSKAIKIKEIARITKAQDKVVHDHGLTIKSFLLK